MAEKNISETSLYLTFKLGEEMFALDVAQVREVLDLSSVTKVPKTLDFMKGVINVRGSVVPVMDLRMKFDMPATKNTIDTRTIVMELNLDGETTVLGALADSVHEVIELDPEQIEPPPRIGSRWRTDFIKGVGKRDDAFIIILDIDRVFSVDELTAMEGSATHVPLEVNEQAAVEVHA
jgi:purine-binding chemotaxis protein CheW